MATRKIETELALSGEKEFNDAMKGVNSNLKNIRADMARVTAEFDGNADSMEALTAKEKVLQDSVDQHRAKVDALQRMYDKQKEKYGENSAQADKYRLQLTQATTALLKEENALKKNTAAIAAKKAADIAAAEEVERLAREQKEAAEAAERLAKEQKKAAEEAERLAKEQKEAADTAEAAAKKQKQLAERMEKTERRTEALKNGLQKLGTATGAAVKATAAGVAAVAAAGGAALIGLIGTAKEAADAAKAAQEAGEDLTETQQRWLDFSAQLDDLSSSTTAAKNAIAGILLPALSALSEEGSDFLNDFVQALEAAAGDTEKQAELLGQYIADGAKRIMQMLPEYVAAGKTVVSGISQGFSESGDELLDMGLEMILELLYFVLDEAPILVEGGLELAQKLIEGLDQGDIGGAAVRLVERLATSFINAAPTLVPAAAQLVSSLVVSLIKNEPKLKESAQQMVLVLALSFVKALVEIDLGSDVVDAIIESMRNSSIKFFNQGAEIAGKIKDGIADALSDLSSWLGGLLDTLLSKLTFNVNINPTASAAIDGSHASGLRYVPFDGYLAQLHRGEAVLPAAEAAAYRSGQGAGTKVFNMTINTKSVSREEMDMLYDYMNGKLGDDL